MQKKSLGGNKQEIYVPKKIVEFPFSYQEMKNKLRDEEEQNQTEQNQQAESQSKIKTTYIKIGQRRERNKNLPFAPPSSSTSNQTKNTITSKYIVFKPKKDSSTEKTEKTTEDDSSVFDFFNVDEKEIEQETKEIETIISTKSPRSNERKVKKFSLRNKLKAMKDSMTIENKRANKNESMKTLRSAESKSSLYERGMLKLKEKEEKISREKRRKENEYKKYSYRPKINKISFEGNHRSFDKSIYERQSEWKFQVDQKNSMKFIDNSNEEMSNCTFKPKINRSIKENDIKFIQQNLFQIVNYVKKRQEFLEHSNQNYGGAVYLHKKAPSSAAFFKTKSKGNQIGFLNRTNSKGVLVSKIREDLGISSFFDQESKQVFSGNE